MFCRDQQKYCRSKWTKNCFFLGKDSYKASFQFKLVETFFLYKQHWDLFALTYIFLNIQELVRCVEEVKRAEICSSKPITLQKSEFVSNHSWHAIYAGVTIIGKILQWDMKLLIGWEWITVVVSPHKRQFQKFVWDILDGISMRGIKKTNENVKKGFSWESLVQVLHWF